MSDSKQCPIRLIAWNTAVSADLTRQYRSQHSLASRTDELLAKSTPDCIGEECAMWDERLVCCGLTKGV